MGRLKDMTGHEFNGCVVLERCGTNRDKKATWKCRCYCGGIFVTTGKSIRLKLTKSCGCLRKEILSESGFKNRTHGESGTRLYNIWRGIKKRCRLEKSTSYKFYGAKGIDICDDWYESYESFRDWALGNGYEEYLTIERIDSKGNYNPNNCKWADWNEQARNRSNNVRLEFEGEYLTQSEIAERIGISRELLHYRIKNDIPLESDLKVRP